MVAICPGLSRAARDGPGSQHACSGAQAAAFTADVMGRSDASLGWDFPRMIGHSYFDDSGSRPMCRADDESVAEKCGAPSRSLGVVSRPENSMSAYSVHSMRVMKLYRHSLKNLQNWAVHRDLFIERGFAMRAEFDANKFVKDPRLVEKIVSDGEAKLAEFRHPDPYTRESPDALPRAAAAPARFLPPSALSRSPCTSPITPRSHWSSRAPCHPPARSAAHARRLQVPAASDERPGPGPGDQPHPELAEVRAERCVEAVRRKRKEAAFGRGHRGGHAAARRALSPGGMARGPPRRLARY